jgi:hypothetical protein
MTRTISRYSLFVALVCFMSSCVDSKPIYDDPTEGKLLLGATLHLGNGDIIENAAIGVKDGYVTLLADARVSKLDLNQFQVERLGPEYHIYPFRKTQLGNSGIVLARSQGGSINITIRDRELEKCVTIGCEAMLLICRGSIQDASRFRVDYVYLGSERVKILNQSDYSVSTSVPGE